MAIRLVYFLLFLGTVAFAASYDLPLLFIRTNGQTISDEPKITATMRVLDEGENAPGDSAKGTLYNIGIETRGQTSASFDKKGYGVEIHDSAGNSLEIPLLGLPDGDDWVLHGPYIDKTLIRNAIAHYLYQQTGRYSPRFRFVELYLNENYNGVYLLLEKIKRDKNRVPVSKLNEDSGESDALTGGYIFRIDKSDDINSEGFKSNDGLQFIYHYPTKNNISAAAKTYLQNTVNNFEKLMDAGNWNDANTGYSSVIDVDAAVDYILHEEMLKNSDAYLCSFYMFKDKDSKGGKIQFGPPWDFNLAIGAVSYNNNMDTTGWQTEQNMTAGTYFIAPWIKKIFEDAAFQAKMKARWAELRASVWHTKNIDAFIDSLSDVLRNGSVRNFDKWKVLGSATCADMGTGWITYNFCYNGYSEPTWDAEVEHLRGWFKSRIHWIDGQFGFTEPAEPVKSAVMAMRQSKATAAGNDLCMRTTEGFRISASRAGILNLYNLDGECIWRAAVRPGEQWIELPPALRSKALVAKMNGRIFTGSLRNERAP